MSSALPTFLLFIISLFGQFNATIFDTATNDEFKGQTLTCADNEECTVICDKDSACFNADIDCPTNANCSVTCRANFACMTATINCPPSNQCTIKCISATATCSYTTFNPPSDPTLFDLSWGFHAPLAYATYPIYPIDDNANFTLICDSTRLCESMFVICPSSAHCNIECIGSGACNNMDVTWPTIPGYGHITCNNTNACDKVDFPIPYSTEPYTLQCTLAGTCKRSTITCPTGSSCNIICSGIDSCLEATIHCPLNGDCTVSCTNTSSCDSALITWSEMESNTGTLICDPIDSCFNVSLPPSTSPTGAPSNSPTYPSIPPTPAPTVEPTFEPTLEPTMEPTMEPTIYPTNNPTASPTVCLDYDENYNSLDGDDIILKSKMDQDILFADTLTVIQYETNNGALSEKWITCTDDGMNDVDNCFIGCYESDGCVSTRIEPENNVKLDEFRLICNGTSSCEDVIVNVTKNVEIADVAIICSVHKACDSMVINIESSTPSMAITLYCNETRSCANVIMNLTANKMEMNAYIYCFQVDACEELQVYTDHSERINLNIFMYQHSDDVFIDFEWFKDDMVHCQQNGDHRYIRYGIEKLLDSDGILDLAEKEYESNKLPCSDIKVQCQGIKDDIIHRECEFGYNVNVQVYNLTKILQLKESHSCFWMDIGTLIRPQCKGNCNTNLTFHEHSILLYLDIEPIGLNMSENTQNITEQIICEEHFISTNITQRTIGNIDAIFEFGLNSMISMNNIHGIGLIRDLLIPPETVLRGNIRYFDCNSSELDLNPIKIYTTFKIESAIEDISNLFIENSNFINSSSELISNLFGVKVILRVVSISDVKKIYKLEIIISVSALLVIVVFIAIYCYRKVLKREEKYAINVRNPLVIPYCIGQYDEFEDQNIDLQLSPDVNNVRRFCKRYNYEFGKYQNPENDYDLDTDDHTINLEWPAHMLTEDLEFQAEKLESNLATAKEFDALLVIVSCHGHKDGIFTSDHKTIPQDDIHRIFSMTRPLSRKIPRMFLFDCCAGSLERARTTSRYTDKEPETDDNQDVIHDMETKDGGKNVPVVERVRSQVWYMDEENPDYKLVRIDAANVDFQSKMSSETGSYLITSFINKLMEENRQKTFLYQIMDEIQSELHDKGKQLTVAQYFNKTRYIRFIKNVTPKIISDTPVGNGIGIRYEKEVVESDDVSS